MEKAAIESLSKNIEATEEEPSAPSISELSDADAVKEFWEDLQEYIDEDPDCIEFESFWKTIEKYPAILKSRNSDGSSLTEFLCWLEAGATVRDFLEVCIEAGAEVTTKCYENAIFNPSYYPCCPDMLNALLDSGFFPLELRGLKTFDLIVKEGEQDSIEQWFSERLPMDDDETPQDDDDSSEEKVVMLPRPEVGKTHVAGGHFEKWYEKKSTPKRPVMVAVETNTKPTTKKVVPKATKTKTEKKRASPKSVVSVGDSKRKNPADDDTIHCLVKGCQTTFKSQAEMQEHMDNSKGKAHVRFREEQGPSAASAKRIRTE
jgi:hypothetical protein